MLGGISPWLLHACGRTDQWRSNLKSPFFFGMRRRGFVFLREGGSTKTVSRKTVTHKNMGVPIVIKKSGAL